MAERCVIGLLPCLFFPFHVVDCADCVVQIVYAADGTVQSEVPGAG